MITLSRGIILFLFFAVFWSGLCFGLAIGIYLVNRRYKKMKEREQIIDIVPKGKKVVLIDLGGGKGKEK